MITVQLPKGSVSRSGDYNTQESNVGEENPPNPLRTRGGSRRPAEERLARRWLCGLSPRGAWGTAEEKGALTARSNLGEKRERGRHPRKKGGRQRGEDTAPPLRAGAGSTAEPTAPKATHGDVAGEPGTKPPGKQPPQAGAALGGRGAGRRGRGATLRADLSF